MKNVCLLMLVLVFCSATIVFAKRTPPKDVAPLRPGKLELRAPHNQMGCVEAWDMRSGSLVWRRQIYVVKYDVVLERDIQDVFITSLEIEKDVLTVKNERGSTYELKLETLEVKPIKGLLVEQTKV